ncbi:MAG: hypothetical protein AAF502_20670 [Bacteroidota bacterium]
MKLKPILTLLLSVLLCHGVSACSCWPLGEIDVLQYNQAEYVFVGVAESVVIDEENMQRIVTFRIKKKYKSPRKGKRVVIQTALQSATCGLGISQGQTWYIWAAKGQDGIYRSSLCTRSMRIPTNINDSSQETTYHKDITFMKSLKKVRGTTTFTYDHGKAIGKLRRGCPIGSWNYYDENGDLRLVCSYGKRGQKISCTDTSAKN